MKQGLLRSEMYSNFRLMLMNLKVSEFINIVV